jgi:hypothetical protein
LAKRETKETYNATKTAQQNNQQNFETARKSNDTALNEQKTSADNSRAEVSNLYRGLVDSSPFSVGGTASYANVDTNPLKGIGTKYGEFSSTGGYTPERTASIEGQVNQLKDFGKTGGLDENSMTRLRGNGVFDEQAKTGGYSDTDIKNIRARGLSPISAYATNTKNELDRRLAVQGGYGPGFDEAAKSLRRETARGITDTALNTELDIKDRVNAGKMAGATALSGAEGNLQSLRTGNMFKGIAGAGDMETQLQNSINQYRLQGLNGEQAVARAVADVESANSTGAMNANMFNIQNQQMIDQANQENSYKGITGLEGIYGSDNANVNASLDRGINLLGGQANTDLGYLGDRTQLATQPGAGGNLIRGIGAAAGVGSALLGSRGIR